jgi:hypothetical protein
VKPLALLLFLGLSICNCLGHDAPDLKTIMARYDQARLTPDETFREKFVMELARLRWSLAQRGKEGWEDVDAELRRHPAKPDTTAFSKARVGKWISPRHDYLFRANGTWLMTDISSPDATHGTWSVDGTDYVETVAVQPSLRNRTRSFCSIPTILFMPMPPMFTTRSGRATRACPCGATIRPATKRGGATSAR